jgi:hypothetical protein
MALQTSVGTKDSQYSWSSDGILYRTREIVRTKSATASSRAEYGLATDESLIGRRDTYNLGIVILDVELEV